MKKDDWQRGWTGIARRWAMDLAGSHSEMLRDGWLKVIRWKAVLQRCRWRAARRRFQWKDALRRCR
jgi:hypothetical protein